MGGFSFTVLAILALLVEGSAFGLQEVLQVLQGYSLSSGNALWQEPKACGSLEHCLWYCMRENTCYTAYFKSGQNECSIFSDFFENIATTPDITKPQGGAPGENGRQRAKINMLNTPKHRGPGHVTILHLGTEGRLARETELRPSGAMNRAILRENQNGTEVHLVRRREGTRVKVGLFRTLYSFPV